MKQKSNIHRSNEHKSYLQLLFELPIEEMPDLPPKIIRRVSGCGIETVGELITRWSERKLAIQGYRIGKGSVKAINISLATLGLRPLGNDKPRKELELAT